MRGGCGVKSFCQTALLKGLRKLTNALPLFRSFACTTWWDVYGLIYLPFRHRRVFASSVLVSINW